MASAWRRASARSESRNRPAGGIRRAVGRPRHRDRLGGHAQIEVRPAQCPRDRDRGGDLRPRRRRHPWRPARPVPHPPPPAPTHDSRADERRVRVCGGRQAQARRRRDVAYAARHRDRNRNWDAVKPPRRRMGVQAARIRHCTIRRHRARQRRAAALSAPTVADGDASAGVRGGPFARTLSRDEPHEPAALDAPRGRGTAVRDPRRRRPRSAGCC